MDFELPDDIRALQSSIRDFCEKRVKGPSREWDRTEKFPMDVVKELGAMGVMGIRVAEDHGGRFHLHSTPDVGTTATLVIPYVA